jgi:KRAB domain-containing zinc finger protein
VVVHKCEWCGLCFTHEEDLPHHQKRCLKKPIANPVTTSTSEVNVEGSSGSSVDVGGGGARTHRCEICGWEFARSDTLKNHRLTHTGEKPFPCATCGKRFARQGYLTTHMSIHTKEKPHKCTTCGRGFALRSHLTTHMRLHTGATPFKCEVCGEEFAHSSSLRSHTSKHTGVYRHQCTVDKCQYKSNNAYNLKLHASIHSTVKPYKCHVCGQGFTFKGNLKGHVKRVHEAKEK